MGGVVNRVRSGRWRRGAAILLSVILLAIVAGAILLPVRIARRVLPELAGRFGFSGVAVEVRRLDPFAADIGPLRLGPPTDPVLRLDAVRAEYSLAGLLRRRVDRVRINGLHLRAELTPDGRLVVPELDLAAMRPPTEKPGPAASPWRVGRCEIRNATLALHHGGRTHRLEFEADAAMDGTGAHRLVLRIFPRGEGITVTGSMHNTTPGVVELSIPRLELGRFADLTERHAGIRLRGDLALTGSYRFSDGEFRVKGRIAALAFEQGTLRVRNARLADGSEVPLDFRAEGTKGDIRFQLGRFQVADPVGVDVAMPEDGILRIRPDRSKLSLPLHLAIDAEALCRRFSLPMTPTEPLRLDLKIDGTWDPARNWEIAVNPSPTSLSWRLVGDMGETHWTWRQIQVRGRGQGPRGGGRIGIRLADVAFRREGASASVPALELLVDVNLGDAGVTASGSAKFADARAEFGATRIDGIAATLPWQWPTPQGKTQVVAERKGLGRFDAARLRFGDMELGSLGSELYQDGIGYVFIARHEGVIPGVKIAASGLVERRADAAGGLVANMEFSLEEAPTAGIELDLARFAPALGEAILSGKPTLSGQVAWQAGRLTGTAKIGLTEGRFRLPSKELQVEGINTSVTFSEVAELRTAPRQRLRFSSMRAGNMEFRKGNLYFQVEPKRQLFLEQAEVQWCGGRVLCHAFRYRPGQKKELSLTLFCDRLLLTDLLRQLKIANAEGEGAVSGQIPLVIVGDLIDLTGGFLYSRPGQGGVLHVVDAGLFAGAEQSLQVAIAREALQDYAYDWVTINLDRDGRDLLMRMELAGRPARLLPFGLSPQGGLFKAESDSRWRANFQGINFLFNFRLPLEQVLEYGKDMDGILENAVEDAAEGAE